MNAAPASVHAWVNGERGGTLSPFDRGLAYGDGLFETMRFRAGAIPLLQLHLDRLAVGCARLGIALEREMLASELLRCVDGVGGEIGTGVVKLIVTRGVGGRGYRASGAGPPTRVVVVSPLPSHPPEWARDGIAVRLCETRLGANPLLAGIKHLNRLEQVLARSEWDEPEIAEGLLSDQRGRIVEGISSNLFVLSGGRLLTPVIDTCGVEGVMRRYILEEAARQAGVTVAVAHCERAVLAGAQEMFLCNSVVGIWPVRRVGQRQLPVGAVTRRLQGVVAQLFDE